MTDLSPAAQAVLDAFVAAKRSQTRTAGHHKPLAAALRAFADQACPGADNVLPPAGDSHAGHYVHGWMECQLNARRDLLAIAAELEGTDG